MLRPCVDFYGFSVLQWNPTFYFGEIPPPPPLGFVGVLTTGGSNYSVPWGARPVYRSRANGWELCELSAWRRAACATMLSVPPTGQLAQLSADRP